MLKNRLLKLQRETIFHCRKFETILPTHCHNIELTNDKDNAKVIFLRKKEKTINTALHAGKPRRAERGEKEQNEKKECDKNQNRKKIIK